MSVDRKQFVKVGNKAWKTSEERADDRGMHFIIDVGIFFAYQNEMSLEILGDIKISELHNIFDHLKIIKLTFSGSPPWNETQKQKR